MAKVNKNNDMLQGEYWYGVGRRKTSTSSVRIYSSKDKEHTILVNSKPINEYFTIDELRKIINSPLKVIQKGKYLVNIMVKGGGKRGQAEASRLGIARALVNLNNDLKKELKDLGYLTRDSRMVERKKPGLKKARRAPQFSKR